MINFVVAQVEDEDSASDIADEVNEEKNIINKSKKPKYSNRKYLTNYNKPQEDYTHVTTKSLSRKSSGWSGSKEPNEDPSQRTNELETENRKALRIQNKLPHKRKIDASPKLLSNTVDEFLNNTDDLEGRSFKYAATTKNKE